MRAALRRFLAQSIFSHKGGDQKQAQKLLDAAIEHITKTAASVVQQQQPIQPIKKTLNIEDRRAQGIGLLGHGGEMPSFGAPSERTEEQEPIENMAQEWERMA